MKTHVAKWKQSEKVKNSFGATITSFIEKDELQGFFDILSAKASEKADRVIDTSNFMFITYRIVPIKIGDILEINNKEYKVTFVDNPLFMNKQLEIGLENNN